VIWLASVGVDGRCRASATEMAPEFQSTPTFARLPIRLQRDAMTRKGLVVDLHLILRQGARILFGLRRNTGFSDGMYHLPAGHLEDEETISVGAIREAKEELGIDIHPDDLHLVHVMHQRSGRLSLFFEVGKWSGDLVNAESHKCESLDWIPGDRLPVNVVAYAAAALQLIRDGENVGTYGWD
jgi:8-oxo-dGTP diphosphatase